MRTLGIITLCVFLLIGGGFIWYKLAYPAYTYRFRLSIAVEVGGETKVASSVIEVRVITQPLSPVVSPIRNEISGEAAFLDLGAKGNVVVLLGCNPGGTEDCVGTLVPNEFGIGGVENLARLETLRGSRELFGTHVPTLVTFRDLNDPKSGRVVPTDKFQQIFGPDVHFKRMWIEMTKDPVTRGIEQKMPMLISHRDPMRSAYSEPTKFTAQYHLFTRS